MLCTVMKGGSNLKGKRMHIIALMLCFIFAINAIKPMKSQEVKAVIFVPAGAYVVGAVLISAGVYAESANIQKFSTDIYNTLTTEDKTYLDSKGNLVSYSTLNGIKIMPDVYNRIIDKVKGYFGATPSATWNSGYFGSVATSTSAYSYNNSTSPINCATLTPLSPSFGVFNISWSFQGGGKTTPYYITCPDGFKIRMNLYEDSRITQTIPLIPCIYAGNDLKFWQKEYDSTLGWGYKLINSGYWDWSTSTDNGSTWSAWAGSNVTMYNVLMAHVGSATPAGASIDTVVYAQQTTTQAVNDMSLQVSKNFDTLAGLSAEQITATETVGNNILSIGANMVNSITNLGSNIINGLTTTGTNIINGIIEGMNTIGNTITGTIVDVGNTLTSIKDWCITLPQSIVTAIEDALTWAFVPSETFWVDTFNAIKAPILLKYPNNLLIMESLAVGGDSFNDIHASLYYGNGQQAGDAVVVKAKFVNDNIDWIRSATSAIWLFLLVVYVWRKLNGFLSGNDYVQSNQTLVNGGFK